MENNKHTYTLGLDIGTNSIGWAVIDESYNLVKKLKHSLWGVRMFDESHAAAERRTYRNARRRLKRRKERLNYLQDIFADEVKKTDPYFFTRLNESFYQLEDRSLKCNDLFVNGLTNAEYYKKYPTIWHLRKYLLESNEKVDVRFLYLACHHILKYRGNFLTEGEFKKGDNSDLLTAFNDINNVIDDLYNKFNNDEEFEGNVNFFISEIIDNKLCDEIVNILSSKMTKTDKRKQLEEKLTVCDGDKIIKETAYNKFIIPLLLESSVNPKSLKIVKEKGINHDDTDLTKLNLTDEDLDTKLLQYSNEYYEIKELIDSVTLIKLIKDHCFLLNFLGNKTYLSEAMVEKYNEHNEQLREFKVFIKNYLPNKYFEIFRTYNDKICNYAHYVGRNHVNSSRVKDKITNFSHCKQDDFYTYVKKLLENVTQDEAQESKKYFLDLIENKEFLVRTNSSNNAAFPMQLHLMELKQILSIQSKYYPFLNELSDNLTNIEKIIKIFMFKRPYYFGPLNDKSDYAWVIRNSYDKVTPWNVDKVINADETAKKFIEKMQNKCTYLKGDNDYCLPKNSIIFQKYNVLSYINKIKINGKNIDNETKLDIYNNVFLAESKPTQKMIKNYLVITKNIKESDISSIDVCNCSMASYITFKNIFKDKFNELLTRKDNNIEDIIKDITVFEDKKILEKRLKEIYKLNSEEIKQIKNLSYNKYGRLCKKLLVDLIFVDKETNVKYHGILDIMEKTTLNLQEILFSPIFEGNKVIDEYNKQHTISNKMKIEDFIEENLTVSPIYTRALVQTYRLIEELENKILKQKIDYFVVECTRENQASNTTKSRYEKVKELLAECKKMTSENNIFNDIPFDELNRQLDENKDNMKADKLYLYFTQLGRDMYTAEPIDINEINNNKEYDIDHILPQSLIKDDSISNRVLVNKRLNHNKSDKFIFESIDVSKNIPFYKMLLDKELISKKKYNLLTMKELDEKELEGFVNRQKVATDQSVKAVITMLKLFKNVDSEHIIYSKANIVSEFRRNEFLYDKEDPLTGELRPRVTDSSGNNLKHIYYKSRTANNYHHAHDAYLNAIIGSALTAYYDKISIGFKNSDERKEYLEGNYITRNPMKVLARRISGTPWDPKVMLPKIEKNLFNNYDIQETLRTYKSNEMISQVTIIPKGTGNPVKVKNIMPNGEPYNTVKYGGFKQPSYSKFVLIKTQDKKNNELVILQPIPKMYEDTLDEYLGKLYGEFNIINDNINNNVILEYGKTKAYLTGVSNNAYLFKNAIDRNFDVNSIRIIHDIDKYFSIPEKERDKQIKFINDKIIISDVKNQRQISISLNDLDYLYQKIYEMYGKDTYSFSNIKKIYYSLPNVLDDKFKHDDYKTKLYLLNQLLSLLKTNERKSADLTAIGLAKHSGVLQYNIKLVSGMKLIKYSITGLKKKVLYEVK